MAAPGDVFASEAELSELFGASQLPTDTFLRTLGWRHVAEEEVAALDDTTRGYYEAYADGVNAYLAEIFRADITAKDFRTWHGTVLAATAFVWRTSFSPLWVLPTWRWSAGRSAGPPRC